MSPLLRSPQWISLSFKVKGKVGLLPLDALSNRPSCPSPTSSLTQPASSRWSPCRSSHWAKPFPASGALHWLSLCFSRALYRSSFCTLSPFHSHFHPNVTFSQSSSDPLAKVPLPPITMASPFPSDRVPGSPLDGQLLSSMSAGGRPCGSPLHHTQCPQRPARGLAHSRDSGMSAE